MNKIEQFFDDTVEQKMDNAKYHCTLFKITSEMDSLFPHFELKYAEAVSGGKPHEIVFSLISERVCSTLVYVFETEQDKVNFATELNLISNSNEKLWK